MYHYLPMLRSAVSAHRGDTARAVEELAAAAASERRGSSPFLATDVCVAVAHADTANFRWESSGDPGSMIYASTVGGEADFGQIILGDAPDAGTTVTVGTAFSSTAVDDVFADNGETFTAGDENRFYTLSTCGTADFDTKISVYTGSCGELLCIGSNDDAGDCGVTSELIFQPALGQVDDQPVARDRGRGLREQHVPRHHDLAGSGVIDGVLRLRRFLAAHNRDAP